MNINSTVENLLDLIKIHSFEESTPGFILSLKTLINLEENNHIPTMNLLASGYHSIFGIPALASPYIPDNVIGIMDLKKAEILRRNLNLEKNGTVFLGEIKELATSGLFIYAGEQYMMFDKIEEKPEIG